MIEVMMKMRIMGDISEERITLRIFNLFYANNLILCAESEEHLRVMTEHQQAVLKGIISLRD